MTKAQRADRIIETVRKYGSDTDNLRDAAHEAHHALDSGLAKGKWQRENIHKKLLGIRLNAEHDGFGNYKRIRTPLWQLIAYEMDARAVEQLVCKELDVEIKPIEHWAHISFMEAMKNIQTTFPIERFILGVNMRVEHNRVRGYVNSVLALGGR